MAFKARELPRHHVLHSSAEPIGLRGLAKLNNERTLKRLGCSFRRRMCLLSPLFCLPRLFILRHGL